MTFPIEAKVEGRITTTTQQINNNSCYAIELSFKIFKTHLSVGL